MKTLQNITILALMSVTALPVAFAQEVLVWPAAPDKARISYVGEIRCDKLKPGSGFFGSISRLVGGRGASDQISLPFAPLVVGDDLYLVCQNIKSLVRINRQKNSFQLIEDKEKTLRYPIALCRGVEGEIFLSDTESATIYRLRGGRLEQFIRTGLNRPTGIAFDQNTKRLYVVDTGEHRVHIFDLNGEMLGSFPESNDTSAQLNYPIAVAVTESGSMIVNDALNFKIKRFSASGSLENVFGFEGDVPGAFARPKGIALDSDGHVYVVDNLFDNFQIFDAQGATLLAVGSAGQESGEFWSPGGIDIVADTLYIADTYNNRVQLFTYLGDER